MLKLCQRGKTRGLTVVKGRVAGSVSPQGAQPKDELRAFDAIKSTVDVEQG